MGVVAVQFWIVARKDSEREAQVLFKSFLRGFFRFFVIEPVKDLMPRQDPGIPSENGAWPEPISARRAGARQAA
jgi:hypothetical protein